MVEEQIDDYNLEPKKGIKFWLWIFLAASFALVILYLFISMVLSGDKQLNKALETGQKLSFDLENKEVLGLNTQIEIIKEEKEEEEKPESYSQNLDNTTENTEAQEENIEETDSFRPAAPKFTGMNKINEKLLSETSQGKVPTVSDDGIKPYLYYSRNFTNIKMKYPIISVIIKETALSKFNSDNVLKLPYDVTFSISPYSANAMEWGKLYREYGHETLIDLPLEPHNFPITDPGPKAILKQLTDEERERRINWNLSRAQGYVGILTPRKENYSYDNDLFEMLNQKISNKHGLLFVYGHHSQGSSEDPKGIKKTIGNPENKIVTVDIHADIKISESEIKSQLEKAEKIAKEKGYAVVVANPYPISVDIINDWSKSLSDKGIALAPISAIYKKATSN